MAASFSNSTNIQASLEKMKAIFRDPAFCSTLNLELKSENPTANGVWFRFHHGVTFTSWGEKITITLTPLSADVVKMDILSECGMPTQVLDWGKNKQNANAICEYVNKNLRKVSSERVFVAPVSEPAAESDTKFCFNCGKKISADSAFCCFCGTKQG